MSKVNLADVEEVLTRGVSHIYPSREALRTALFAGKRLKVYLGADPTGAHLHLGHLTNLLTLKRLQKLGHEIIFLIGDFTAMIGDPSGKIASRPVLTEKEVKKNMRTFERQASQIISFSGMNKAEVVRNSKWFAKMRLVDFIHASLGYYSVQNLLRREGFKERIDKDEPFRLQEFIYPLLQGYDGVEMDVDVEVGGNDQVFNMSLGRTLREAHSRVTAPKPRTKKGEKFFIATALLVNPNTGKKLMNKSEGGLINLDDKPWDVFGKVMALDDASMFPVAELSTEMPLARVTELREAVKSGAMNPKDAKLEIASWVVRVIYGEKKAHKAQEKFESVFSKKDLSGKFPTLRVKGESVPGSDAVSVGTTVLIGIAGVTKSKSEARRLVAQGGLRVNGESYKDPSGLLVLHEEDVIQMGKRHFFRAKVK